MAHIFGSHTVVDKSTFNGAKDPAHWKCTRCGNYFKTWQGRDPKEELEAENQIFGWIPHALGGMWSNDDTIGFLKDCDLSIILQVQES